MHNPFALDSQTQYTLDVLGAEGEGPVEEPVVEQERALARAAAAPEVGVVERLAVLEARGG